MANQLWVSPITGYRRRGTRLSELRDLLGAGITAHAILEPLQSCREDAQSLEMRDLLERRDFDVAGVCSDNGAVIGKVTRVDLVDEFVRDHMQDIRTDVLMSNGTPLPEVLLTLKRMPFSFVLIGAQVRGIVARTDINKPPVRVYLFGLISLLEMHLAFWVRSRYPDDSWKIQLKPIRIDKAQDELERRMAFSSNNGLVDCLQFCDKRDIVAADGDIREKLRMGGEKSTREKLRSAEKLRNLLAHSQQNISEGSSWEDLISLIEWIEGVVRLSDELIEERAVLSANRFDDGLLASI
jgi:hypothetical protein